MPLLALRDPYSGRPLDVPADVRLPLVEGVADEQEAAGHAARAQQQLSDLVAADAGVAVLCQHDAVRVGGQPVQVQDHERARWRVEHAAEVPQRLRDDLPADLGSADLDGLVVVGRDDQPADCLRQRHQRRGRSQRPAADDVGHRLLHPPLAVGRGQPVRHGEQLRVWIVGLVSRGEQGLGQRRAGRRPCVRGQPSADEGHQALAQPVQDGEEASETYRRRAGWGWRPHHRPAAHDAIVSCRASGRGLFAANGGRRGRRSSCDKRRPPRPDRVRVIAVRPGS